MTMRTPDPSQLRSSAAALIQLADDLEVGNQPNAFAPTNQDYLLPHILLGKVVEELIDEGKQRRKLFSFGAYSDEALSILLAIFSAKGSNGLPVAELASITGLPLTTSMRLANQLIECGMILPAESAAAGTHRLLKVSQEAVNQLLRLLVAIVHDRCSAPQPWTTRL